MDVHNIINILKAHPNQKVILTMLTRQDFDSDDSWMAAYHGRFKVNWETVSQEMLKFSKKFEEHMEPDMPLGSTADDYIVFLNKYFKASELVIANVFTQKDFTSISPGKWVAFASLINDDYPTDKLIRLTY